MTDTVYEVVVSTDEGYFTVVVTDVLEQAKALAARGNELLDGGPREWLRFEVKEHAVMEVDAAAWTRQDFIDSLDHPEPECWFSPEEPRDA